MKFSGRFSALFLEKEVLTSFPDKWFLFLYVRRRRTPFALNCVANWLTCFKLVMPCSFLAVKKVKYQRTIILSVHILIISLLEMCCPGHNFITVKWIYLNLKININGRKNAVTETISLPLLSKNRYTFSYFVMNALPRLCSLLVDWIQTCHAASLR